MRNVHCSLSRVYISLRFVLLLLHFIVGTLFYLYTLLRVHFIEAHFITCTVLIGSTLYCERFALRVHSGYILFRPVHGYVGNREQKEPD